MTRQERIGWIVTRSVGVGLFVAAGLYLGRKESAGEALLAGGACFLGTLALGYVGLRAHDVWSRYTGDA